jgi:hypothetical protein
MTSMSFCLSLKPCSNSCFSGGLPSAHFGKQLHRAELVWEFDLAALRVVELRQAVIGGNFSDGRLQNLHQVLNCLIPCSWHFSAFRAQQAEQEGIELRDRIRAAYPFHPALIDLMRERWAAIPDFHRNARGPALSGDVSAVSQYAGEEPRPARSLRRANSRPAGASWFFKEVGQQPDFQPCLEHDFIGANARARRIDERRAKEFPGEAVKRPAMRIATAILMYSFGGLRREGGGESEILAPGISEPELLAICVSPDLDSTTVLACLKCQLYADEFGQHH